MSTHNLIGGQRVVALAIPLMVSSLASVGLGFFAAVQVAPQGADALTAVGFGAMLTSLVQVLGLGFFAGGRIAIAQALGAGDAPRAAALSRRMLLIALVLSIVALALVPLSATLVWLVDVPPSAAPAAADYLAVRLMGAPTMIFLDAAVHIVQGRADAKDTRLTMLAIIVLCGVAIAVAPPLIAALGVTGAAWAANIGIVAGLALLVPRVVRASRGGTLHARAFPIMALGWPLAALNLADVASALALQALLAHLGDAELAAHVLVLRLTGVTSLPAYAIGDALSVMIGRAAGAARPDLVRAVARVSLQLAIAFVAIVTTTFVVGSEALASAIGATPDVAAVAGRLMIVAAICQLVEGVVAVGLGALAGLGQTRYLLFATLVTAWLVKLPMAALLVSGFGIEAAWWATGLELAILAVLVMRRLGARSMATTLGRSQRARFGELRR